jgi:hypothetical protein
MEKQKKKGRKIKMEKRRFFYWMLIVFFVLFEWIGNCKLVYFSSTGSYLASLSFNCSFSIFNLSSWELQTKSSISRIESEQKWKIEYKNLFTASFQFRFLARSRPVCPVLSKLHCKINTKIILSKTNK